MTFVDSFFTKSIDAFRFRASIGELPGLRGLAELQGLASNQDASEMRNLPEQAGSIRSWADAEELVEIWRAAVDSEFWPEAILVTGGNDGNFLERIVSAERDTQIAPIGLSSVRLPPDEALLQFVRESGDIEAVWSGESPIRLIEPEVEIGGEMNVSRSMINTPDAPNRPERLVRIGIIDSGLDLTHADFRPVAADRIKNFTSDPDSIDRLGHGTHVAGISSGLGTRSQGEFTGIAPESELVIAKVLGSSGTGSTGGVIRGVAWAYARGIDVVNISLGSPMVPGYRSPLTVACENLAKNGVVVCLSAGNSGPRSESITSPGDARGVLTVGAVDRNCKVAQFSSCGSHHGGGHFFGKPNLVAPGVSIIAPRSRFSSYPKYSNSYYSSLSGTSMASPVVAGLSARLLGYVRELSRERRAAMVVNALIDSSTTQHRNLSPRQPFEIGRGIPDGAKALESPN